MQVGHINAVCLAHLCCDDQTCSNLADFVVEDRLFPTAFLDVFSGSGSMVEFLLSTCKMIR